MNFRSEQLKEHHAKSHPLALPYLLTMFVEQTFTYNRDTASNTNALLLGSTLNFMKQTNHTAAPDLLIALEESIKLQSHYAELLNMWDDGKRIKFKDADEWIARLREIGRLGKL